MQSELLAEPQTQTSLAADLERDGIVILPQFLAGAQLAAMQQAFALRLRHLRWNDVEGYDTNERFRHLLPDVLTLEQGFVDAALHPLVVETLRDYIGPTFELTEAKGWKSLPTKRDFHGWHGDAWYDQTKVDFIPREVKLAFYLTDVKSGHFSYLKGSHGKQHPRTVRQAELNDVPEERILHVPGPAGTAFLFDTSGIHRQSYPILEPRQACFYCYHDPGIPLQTEDVEYYRYHPLLLNAAFLGNLDAEDMRILGFGNKTNYVPGFARQPSHPWFQSVMQTAYGCKLFFGEWGRRITGKLKRLVGKK
jgi:Phytanoyl-CoA dioxygenase (PhyH)